MSEYGDLDDDIDWDEVILAADAAEQQRAPRSVDHAGTSIETGSSDDVLLFYEVLKREDASLAAFPDIEDLVMLPSASRKTSKTLYEQFRRRRGFLSVTDLTAPGGWCEVQYAYSLLGRRDLKPEARPDRIVTKAGTEIKVDKQIAIKHEKVLEKGRQVHKVLEREVHPEQVELHPTSRIDRWGLKLLNQLVSLATLRDGGKAREIPVFGFVQGTLVLGVMDEIEKRLLPIDAKQDTPTKESGKITSYFASTSPVKKPKTAIYLVDSKTRRIPVIPKEDFTIASRFQLMLYKRLFDTHALGKFEWQTLFAHVGLDADESFSEAFQIECTALCAGLGIPLLDAPLNLDMLAQSLASLHREVGPLDDQLELVYRWRGSSQTSPVKRRAAKKSRLSSSSEEDSELQKAIAASLAEHQTEETRSAVQPDLSMQPGNEQSLTPQSGAAGKRRRKDSEQPSSPSQTPQTIELAHKAAVLREAEEGDIIGSTKFSYQEDKLSAYLDQALAFWQGREPVGVSITDTFKCRSCEFQDGCEWLAAKAEEMRQKAAAKRAEKELAMKPKVIENENSLMQA